MAQSNCRYGQDKKSFKLRFRMEDPSGSGLLMTPDDFLKVFQCICDQNVIRESKKASNKTITINRSDEPSRFKR